MAVAALSGSVWPCCGVGPVGSSVVFGDQTNIVIWDEANRTEHFIRNASFRSGAESFGFIAPTPTKPELHEASTQAFYTLASLNPLLRARRGGVGGYGGGAGSTKSSTVEVIQEADVAGYHATTLKSDDAHAINNWMNEHGYVSTPDIERWARRYTSRGWYLTAFKVIDRSKSAASTGTIRMSFKTEQPFNPFYVPSSNIQAAKRGTLRVYLVSVGGYDASIGIRRIWQRPRWTAAIPEATAAVLAKQVELPTNAIPKNSQVAMFVDNDFPRPAEDDIFFLKNFFSVPGPRVATPSRTIPPPAMASLLVAFGLAAVARRRGRV
jgi:hypothetical protein